MAQRLKTDWTLFLTILAMVCFGLVMVYSSSSVIAEVKFHVSDKHFLLKQLWWAVIAFVVLLWCKRSDYRRWNTPRSAFAGIGIVLLLLLVVFITDGKTHRWLHAGVFSVQPSEFAKPALALFLAHFLSNRLSAINDKYTLLPITLSICAIAFFVAVPDLGTAVVLVVTTVMVMFIAGLDLRYLWAAAALGIFLAIGFTVMQPYRLSRVIDFLDPEHNVLAKVDPEGHILHYAKKTTSTSDPGYQQRQAKIAIGSGGAFGVGLMQGRQKMLYLPEAHTDFIYGVIGEETGFLGCTALLAGFVVVLWRGIRLYWYATDDFGRYLSLTVTLFVFVQALINISVVLHLAPNKGIPLPLISYGGSSLLSTLILLGMLLSVSEHAS
jgi:cell division protein FtsW